MAPDRGKHTDTWIALLVFVGVLAVYVVTLCPTVYPGEPLGAVTAATNTRFVKSLEYPLWRFLARIFTFVSANKAWALNLFSAIFGAATIALLYRIFARFGHTRTRDELIRFRGQPGLAQYAAVAAALLVAFSQTFWRASITASTYTLNAFLLVLVTHLLLRYKETRKKRYFMLYGVVYAVALANFPTMLLLLPVFIVLSVLWCREVYSDWVTLVLTGAAGAILLGIAAFQGPLGYASNLPAYYLKPLRATRTMFDYLGWYWSQIRPVLPMGGLVAALFWLLWLVLPTVPPVVYLAFTKPLRRTEMGRGSAISDAIFKVLAFLYTLFGLVTLLDLVIGPYPMAHAEGFLVAYMVTGGWVCYMLGYWAVLFTGTRAGGAVPGRPRYAKGAYGVLVAILLILPVAGAVKHLQVDESSLAGFTALEDFAMDTLTSALSTADDASGNRVALVVTDPWGDLLEYVRKCRLDDASRSNILLVDVYGARYNPQYVDKYAYLSELLVGRQLRPEADPARAAGVSDAEAVLQYVRRGPSPRPKICLTSDAPRYDPESADLDYRYEFVPQGLVYLLDVRDYYLNVPAERIAAGRKLWDELRMGRTGAPSTRTWPRILQPLARRASKLCNDFGVYCHKYAAQQLAVEFYERALRLDPGNYAALRNLKIAGVGLGADLDVRISNASLEFSDELDKDVRRMVGPGASESEMAQVRRYRSALRLMEAYGLVRDLTVIEDFYQANPLAGARSYPFQYAVISLGALVGPEGDTVLAERGRLYLQGVMAGGVTRTIAQTVQALTDLQRAAPQMPEDKRADTQYWIGEAQWMLNNTEAAEAAFKKAIAIEPGHEEASTRLARLLVQADRREDAVGVVDSLLANKPPTTREDLSRSLRLLRSCYMGGETPDPDGFYARARAYAESNPEQAMDILLLLVDLAVEDKDFTRAGEIVADVERRYDSPAVVRLRKALLAHAEKRYADVLTVEMDPNDQLETPDSVRWHMARGDSYLQQGEAVQALEELEKARATEEAYIRKRHKEAVDRLRGNELAIREQDRRLNMALANSGLQHSPGLWYAALEAAVEQNDPELTKKALDYARLYVALVQASSANEGQKLLTTAHYGWTLFKLEGNTRAARELIEPAALGLPSLAAPKVYYGSVLIAEGDIERGLAFLNKALKMDLGPFERAEAEALIEKYKDYVGEKPEEPQTPVETEGEGGPATPEHVTVETGAEKPGPESEPDSPTAE